MAPPITPAAKPHRPCAFAALDGTVRLVASASAATVVAIFDLVFMALSPWRFWWTGMVLMRIGREASGKGSAGQNGRARTVRKVTGGHRARTVPFWRKATKGRK